LRAVKLDELPQLFTVRGTTGRSAARHCGRGVGATYQHRAV